MPLEISFDDVLDILLLDVTSASVPVDGVVTAAEIYSLTGRLFTSQHVLESYVNLLRRFGGRDKAVKGLQPLRDRFYEEVKFQKIAKPSTMATGAAHHAPSRVTDGISVEVDLLLACLDRCCAFPSAHVFQEVVDGNIYMTYNRASLGPYYLTIKRPMHLTQVRTRVETGAVDTWDMLLGDILLIVSNCIFFNAPEGEFALSARLFLDHCMRCLEEMKDAHTAAVEAQRQIARATEIKRDDSTEMTTPKTSGRGRGAPKKRTRD